MLKIDKNQLENLLRLQEIEAECSKISLVLDCVAEKLTGLETRLREFEKFVQDDESKLDDLRKLYRSKESEIQLVADKVKKSEQKLRSVKTNKEYQSSLKEIEDLKAIIDRIEEEMIESLEHIEETEKNLDLKRKEYVTLCEEVRQEKEKIKAESEEGRERIAQLKQCWDDVASQLSSDLLDKFRTAKTMNRSGTAMAIVRNSICLGCHMNIPPQMYNELQRLDSLKFCPYCQRILYWKES